MNYFSIINSFMLLGLMLCIALSMIQPTLKRKMAVLCLYLSLISPLMAYAFYTARHELPGFSLQYEAAMAVFGPVASLLIYLWRCWVLRQVEGHAAKYRAVIDEPPQAEGENPA